MTTTAEVFSLFVGAVSPAEDGTAPTDAGDRVYSPGMLSTQSGAYPQLKLRVVTETRQSLGRGGVQFLTIATLRAIGEVSAPVKLENVQQSDVEAKLWAFKRQIELAVIGSYPLFSEVQQLVSTQAQPSFDAQATMLAGIQIDFAFEFYEAPEDFAPLITDDLAGVDAHLPNDGPGFSANLPQ